MLQLEEALQRILSVTPLLGQEAVTVREAAGRVLANPAVSSVDLPLFDNSAMDGFAVRAADLAGANADNPGALQWIGKAAAGEVFNGAVQAGTCVRLFTGSPLPNGADAVVMQEDTRPDSTEPNRFWFLDTVKPGDNVRRQGEDIQQGAKLVEAGSRLNSGQLA